MASEEQVYSLYNGSRYFLWLSETIKLPIDQVNFIISQITALLCAISLRYIFHPRNVNAGTRHLFSMVSGMGIIFFCHGRDSFHLAVLSTICYLIMRCTSPRIYHKLVLGFAMVYLSVVQIMRIRSCFGCFVLDITGPLMLLTQKITSLAFSLHDGLARDEKQLSSEQKQLSIRKFPSVIEYFSYVYHFQTILCGPLTFYPDYLSFVEGRHYKQYLDRAGQIVLNGPDPDEPPFFYTVLKKLLGALTFGIFFVTIGPLYPLQRLRADDFVNTPFLTQMFLLVMTTTVARFKYYHAWLIADAVANTSGLGFSGYEIHSQPKWDLVSNVDILNFELATSFRASMENWNKGTMRWLRYIVYERMPYQKTIATYALSAVWHGFYPGYYLCFGTAALVTVAARNVRRCFRYRFHSGLHWYALYEFITFAATKVAVAYIVIPFLLLELPASFRIYRHLYFYLHFLCLFALFGLPHLFATEQAKKAKKDNTSHENNHGLTTKNFSHTSNGGTNAIANGKDKKIL